MMTSPNRSLQATIREREEQVKHLEATVFDLKLHISQLERRTDAKRISEGATPPTIRFYDYPDEDSMRELEDAAKNSTSDQHVIEALQKQLRERAGEVDKLNEEVRGLYDNAHDLRSELDKAQKVVTKKATVLERVRGEMSALKKKVKTTGTEGGEKLQGLGMERDAAYAAMQESQDREQEALDIASRGEVEGKKVVDALQGKMNLLKERVGAVESERDDVKKSLKIELERDGVLEEMANMLGDKQLMAGGSQLEEWMKGLEEKKELCRAGYRADWRDVAGGYMNECVMVLKKLQTEVQLKQHLFVNQGRGIAHCI